MVEPSHGVVEPGMSEERHRFLAEVASLYYEANLTQSQIAKEFDISRSSVSRLLSEARDAGVVDITVRWPSEAMSDLSQRVQDAFGIDDVRIVHGGERGYTQVLETLGRVAAGVLERKLQDNMTLGISWNTGVYQVVRAFRAAHRMGVRVVQLTGSVGMVNPILDGPDLARWLAQMLGGQYLYLPAPLVVENPETRAALLADRTIAERLEVARSADLVLMGIGTVFPPLSSLLQTGYLSEAELAEITAMGGVGDILTTFYDIEGNILPLPFHERTIGLPLEDLRHVPCVIGVAAGEQKASAIVGALRGGYLTCLVTDDRGARAMLRIAAQQR